MTERTMELVMGRAERAEQRREQILLAALDVFADKGYHQASIADIAAVLSIGHGTFYRYFRNKQDIFVAVLNRIFVRIGALVEQEPPNTDSLPEYAEQLHRIASSLFTMFIDDMRQVRIVFFEAVSIDPVVTERVVRTFDMFARFTATYLDNGKAKGFLREDLDVEVAARSINTVIFEGIKQVVSAPDPQVEAQRWVQAGVDMMLYGVGPKT